MTAILAALAGLAAGGSHALAGPDHLAAVAPLAAESGGGSWRVGAKWGLGHALGVLSVGLPLLLVRRLLPLEVIASHGERLVGVTLVGIALWTLRRAASSRLHAHEHGHAGLRHAHLHLHVRGSHPGHGEPRNGNHGHVTRSHGSHGRASAHSHGHAALGIGLLHGVAGSSHLFGVLPALALPTAAAAGAYLASFAAGTVLAMVGFSAFAGLVGGRLIEAGARSHTLLLGALGAVAGAIGTWWLVR